MFIKQIKSIICLTLGVLALSASAIYASSNLPDRDMRKAGASIEDIGPQREEIYLGLGLTITQQKALEDNRNMHREREMILFKQMRAKMELIRFELQKDSLELGQVYQINNDLKKIQAQMLDDRLEGILGVRKILTLEQFKMFTAKMEERGKHFRHKKEEGPKGGF